MSDLDNKLTQMPAFGNGKFNSMLSLYSDGLNGLGQSPIGMLLGAAVPDMDPLMNPKNAADNKPKPVDSVKETKPQRAKRTSVFDDDDEPANVKRSTITGY